MLVKKTKNLWEDCLPEHSTEMTEKPSRITEAVERLVYYSPLTVMVRLPI